MALRDSTKRVKMAQRAKAMLKNPVVNKHGQLIVAKTLAKHNVTSQFTLATQELKKAALEAGYLVPTKYVRKKRSMPFGPETNKLNFTDIQHPALYAIVCKPTGRMYVAISRRPDLRRSVQLYWLRNIDKQGSSNNFRTIPKLVEDVKKHGPDSFYMEILHAFPHGLTDEEMRDDAAWYVSRIKKNLLYNTNIAPGGRLIRNGGLSGNRAPVVQQIEPTTTRRKARHEVEQDVIDEQLANTKIVAKKVADETATRLSKLEKLLQLSIDGNDLAMVSNLRDQIHALKPRSKTSKRRVCTSS